MTKENLIKFVDVAPKHNLLNWFLASLITSDNSNEAKTKALKISKLLNQCIDETKLPEDVKAHVKGFTDTTITVLENELSLYD